MPESQFKDLALSCKTMQEFSQKVTAAHNKPLAAGSGYYAIQSRCAELGLLEHFDKCKGQRQDKHLVELESYSDRGSFKKRILRDGLIEYKCEGCGNLGEWLGKPLVLQLDHKNGNGKEHKIENVRFLCPNCHSQTETWTGKNIRRKETGHD